MAAEQAEDSRFWVFRAAAPSGAPEDASDRIGGGAEGNRLAPCATILADEDLDGIGTAKQVGPCQALVVISPAGGGSEDAVVGERRSSRAGHESDESLVEGRGLEAKRLDTVGEGTRVTEEELALRSEEELLGGEGRTEDVVGKLLAAEAFARGNADG